MMTKTTKEFRTWLNQFSRKHEDTIKELANGQYQVASDEEVMREFSKIEKRYKKVFEDLEKK